MVCRTTSTESEAMTKQRIPSVESDEGNSPGTDKKTEEIPTDQKPSEVPKEFSTFNEFIEITKQEEEEKKQKGKQ